MVARVVTGVRILGPIEVRANGRPLELGGPRQVALFAGLVVCAGEAVSSDQLVEWLWVERPSGSRKRLQMAITRLRQTLAPVSSRGGVSLETVDGGYLLALGDAELDARSFEAEARDGQRALRAGDPDQAREHLLAALARWRGSPLAQVRFQDFAQSEIRRLEEMRLSAIEARIDADLQLGHHDQIIDELLVLVLEHPDRERLTGQLMLALYRSGRQTDALHAFERTRSHLAAELGLRPGPALTRLQDDILHHSPSLGAGAHLAADTAGSARVGVAVRPDPTSGGFSRPPTAATPTVGRLREITQISELLAQREVRMVTLTGPGGVGKTRLAAVVAREVLSMFEHGVCWVELAGVGRAQDVVSAVAHALDVASLPGEAPIEAVCRSIGERHVLLVVDNFEHVLEAAELLAALISTCPALTILVTSREALNLSAEHRFVVLPLAVLASPRTVGLAEPEVGDAGTLFIAAARRYDHCFRVDPQATATLAQICTQLDGLPLALELAAARTPYLTLESLAAGLHRTLTESRAARRDAPARHHTVEATVDWSYRLLDREQRRAFVRFAVFAGGATFDDAIGVTDCDRATLEALVDKSLLHRRHHPDGTIRLTMLETIRAYAADRLQSDPDRNAIRERHLGMALQLVLRECPRLRTHGGRDGLKVLDGEIDNIHAALQWAIEARPSSALKLVGRLAEYWQVRIDFGGLSWLRAVLEASEDSVASSDRARAVFHHALQLGFRDEGEASLAGLNRALSLFREADDPAGAAETLCSLASGSGVFANDDDAERDYAEQALADAQMVGDEALIGRALARLAPSLPGDEREVTLTRAAELLDRVGDYREIASAYNNAAYQTLREGQPERADGLLAPALSAAESVGDAWNLIVIHGTAGLTKVVLGHHDAAREHVRLQLELSREHGLRHNGEGVIALAAIEARRGDYDVAARLVGIARGLGYPPTKHDVTMDERLVRDFLAPARRAYGEGQWRCAERNGAAMPYPKAIAYALGEKGAADADRPATL